ncbi:hypothetical protein ABRZ04_11735 [Castellaniella ginsengisoli]|uniref:Uncharacterized protein n=1 Tax=Castellaniella ginsengisoli TaxID=546114 RepID=A0AB39FLV1_9BURK
MKAVFVELPAFTRYRADYLDDEGFRGLQEAMRDGGSQFWLFTLYDKDEMADLSPDEKKALKGMLKAELRARR